MRCFTHWKKWLHKILHTDWKLLSSSEFIRLRKKILFNLLLTHSPNIQLQTLTKIYRYGIKVIIYYSRETNFFNDASFYYYSSFYNSNLLFVLFELSLLDWKPLDLWYWWFLEELRFFDSSEDLLFCFLSGN